MSKFNYWADKKTLSIRAIAHDKDMRKMYPTEIHFAAKQTSMITDKIFDSSYNTDKMMIHNVYLEDTDTVSAIFKYIRPDDRNSIVLNFASYKNPGGYFLGGSSAQEESLCHESTLYQVLSDDVLKPYYEFNNKNLNRALYLNRALISPRILFERNDDKRYVTVITLAAPNASTFLRYNPSKKDVNDEALDGRIRFLSRILKDMTSSFGRWDVSNVILGAFGCGVFGQDPTRVAALMDKYINADTSIFIKNIIYAIPYRSSDNYKAFDYILRSNNRLEAPTIPSIYTK